MGHKSIKQHFADHDYGQHIKHVMPDFLDPIVLKHGSGYQMKPTTNADTARSLYISGGNILIFLIHGYDNKINVLIFHILKWQVCQYFTLLKVSL